MCGLAARFCDREKFALTRVRARARARARPSQASTGLSADARQLNNYAHDEAHSYRQFYGAPAPISVVATRLANVTHNYTLHSYMRPFGASALVGGVAGGCKQSPGFSTEEIVEQRGGKQGLLALEGRRFWAPGQSEEIFQVASARSACRLLGG